MGTLLVTIVTYINSHEIGIKIYFCLKQNSTTSHKVTLAFQVIPHFLMEPNLLDGNPWVAISTESALKVLTEMILKRGCSFTCQAQSLSKGFFPHVTCRISFISVPTLSFCLSFLQLPSSGISPNCLMNGITVPSFQNWEKEKDLEMCSDDACRVA